MTIYCNTEEKESYQAGRIAAFCAVQMKNTTSAANINYYVRERTTADNGLIWHHGNGHGTYSRAQTVSSATVSVSPNGTFFDLHYIQIIYLNNGKRGRAAPRSIPHDFGLPMGATINVPITQGLKTYIVAVKGIGGVLNRLHKWCW